MPSECLEPLEALSMYIRHTNIIKSIYFDKYTAFGEVIGCYKESIVAAMNKWIGKEFK